MQKYVSILLAAGLSIGAGNAMAGQAEDLAALNKYYQQRFPGLHEQDFGNGPYALDANKRLQWEAMEEFPPYEDYVDKGEAIGAALRTKPKTKPVYISTGHKIDLQNAIHWVMQCCRGYRLPEPARLAHLAAGGNLSQEGKVAVPEVGYQRKLFDVER